MTQRITELEDELATLRRTLAELEGHAEVLAMLLAVGGAQSARASFVNAALETIAAYRKWKGEG